MTAARLARVPPMERGLTLGDFLIPIRLGERAASWQRDLLLVVSGALLITFGAYVSFQVPALAFGNAYVPVNPYVPFSLQTFGVLFTGALLGFRRGIAATGLYLLIGSLGLPVFAVDPATGLHASGFGTIASWSGGLVLGTTGGYLLGFVVAGALVGRLAELGWDRHLRGSVAAMLIGSLVIYAVGVPWLALALGLRGLEDPLGIAVVNGLYPFIPGDVIKLIAAAGLLPIGWRIVERQPHDR
jgi:biotin transport system substrate-specific component